VLKAHHLPQTYQMKLKTLLTFQEIESLARGTGARISRLKGKETPWYEVTLSEARRDALRNRLFQTGHPVEKLRRTRIANLELDRLPPGQFRPLSGGELAALKRELDPDAAPTRSTPRKSATAFKSAARKHPQRKPRRVFHNRSK
jgi:16S rRNA U516 pseudouridylate synthase RsuA-like enzyme